MSEQTEPAEVDIGALTVLREHAHELCLMEQDRVCEQTCEMPDGPATAPCGEQHAAIDALADAAERLKVERDEARRHANQHHMEACTTCAATEAERDEARALHDEHCRVGHIPFADREGCTPLWRKP